MKGLVPFVILVALLAGCGEGPSFSTRSSSPPQRGPLRLAIRNVDGPGLVNIEINDAAVGIVRCGSGTELVDGRDGLPDLPWKVTLSDRNGSHLKVFTVAKGSADTAAVIRGQDVLIGPLTMSVGPATIGRPCPP